MKIPFNKPYLTGKEFHYMEKAVLSGKISGNGIYTQKCHDFFVKNYDFERVFLTNSCTDALEMAAILSNIERGDEVIIPSYTFVSTANAFVLRGAKIIFADSYSHHPNIDPDKLEKLITDKTKVIVVVHYAGIACDMDKIMSLATKYNLLVIEDAAQAIDSTYKGKTLGSIGHFGAFSFHETKNIISGEGGMLAVNDPSFIKRAEIVWEKGTNRVAFAKGEVNKYQWVDVGSSYLPSEITSAFLFSQLEHLGEIQTRRKILWDNYFRGLESLQQRKKISLPCVPNYSTNNAHIFYVCCNDLNERNELLNYLNSAGIYAVFHYLTLHRSSFYKSINAEVPDLPNANIFEETLVRLPLFIELSDRDQQFIIEKVVTFFN